MRLEGGRERKGRERMTHEERIQFIEQQPGETISPLVLAQVIGGRSFTYNLAAKAGRLTLPHVWRGRNLRIFKGPVLQLLKSGRADEGVIKILE